MSVAERQAREIYQSYHLGSLSDDVKRHLMILFLTNDSVNYNVDETIENSFVSEDLPPKLTAEDLRSRVEESTLEIKEGLGRPIDELFDDMETKYPWLCK